MEKEILLLKNKPVIKQVKQVKQIDYSIDINQLAIDIDKINYTLSEINKKPKSIAVDYSDRITEVSNKINLINKSISQKKEVDIELSIKKIVNINYITNLYRNK